MDKATNIVSRIKAICEAEGYVDPVELLVHAQGGVDPRDDLSMLYELVRGVPLDEMPDEDQWALISNLVLGDPVYHEQRITHGQSVACAKVLIKYMGPELKAIEHTQAHIKYEGLSDPLTERDIELFEEKFCRDY